MKKIVSALLVSAAISSPAFAVGFIDAPVGSKYAAADLGSVSYGSGTATTIGVGAGFQVSPYVAIEADYIHLGTYSQTINGVLPGGNTLTNKTDTSGSSLQFMAVGNYAINNDFTAFAKAGIAMNKVKLNSTTTNTLTGSAIGLSTSASSNDLAFAIGMKYKVNKDVALRAQYQDLGTASMNIISIGAMFNF